jgi:hypothetical protein
MTAASAKSFPSIFFSVAALASLLLTAEMRARSGANTALAGKKEAGVEPERLSSNLIIQLQTFAEDPNRRWYEHNTGRRSEVFAGGFFCPSTERWRQPMMDWLTQAGRRLR